MTTPDKVRRENGAGRHCGLLLPMLPMFLTAAMRLLVLTQFVESPFFLPSGGDRGLYHEKAAAIADGKTGTDVFTFMPLYPHLLGGLYRILGESNLASAGILQAILDGLTALMLFGAARRRYGRLAGLLAGFGFAFMSAPATYALVTMPVSLGLFWVLLALTLSDLWNNGWTPLRAAAMGIVLGTGGQVLGAFWLMLVPFGILAYCGSGSRSKLSRRIVCGGLLVACGYACALPTLAMNLARGGQWVFVTAHSGLNLYIGNNPSARGYGAPIPGTRTSAEEMTRDSQSVASKLAGVPLTVSQSDRFWRNAAVRFWREQPGRALRLFAGKAHRLVSAREFDDTGLNRLLPETLPRLRRSFIGFGLVWMLACAGLPWRRSLYGRAAILIMGVSFAVGILMTFVSTRYRLPIAVLLLPAASGTLAALLSMLKPGASGRIPSAAGRPLILLKAWAALAGVVLALLPHPLPDTRLPDDLNRSTHRLQHGDSKGALFFAGRATSHFPSSSEAWFALGNASFARNDYQSALDAYERALQILPGRTDAMHNAATALVMLGRTDEARRIYEQVIEADPANAKSWIALAEILRNAGDVDGAIKCINHAAEIEGWGHHRIAAFLEAQCSK